MQPASWDRRVFSWLDLSNVGHKSISTFVYLLEGVLLSLSLSLSFDPVGSVGNDEYVAHVLLLPNPHILGKYWYQCQHSFQLSLDTASETFLIPYSR